MMRDQHTPGPWKIAVDDVTATVNGWRRSFIIVHSAVHACGQTALVPNGKGEAGKADADLIAAAPEMLAALENALLALDEGKEFQGNSLEVTAQVREAIAKAHGR